MDSIRSAIELADARLAAEQGSVAAIEALLKALHWSLVVESDDVRALANLERFGVLVDQLKGRDESRAARYIGLQCVITYDYAKRLFESGKTKELLFPGLDLVPARSGRLRFWRDAAVRRSSVSGAD